MTRQRFFAAMLLVLVAALCLQSCSGGKTKKEAQSNTVPAAGELQPGGAEAAAPAAAPAPVPVKLRPPAELLAALPCKLDGKKGAFAAFPDNPAAGQVCFSLYPERGNESDIPKFDIQGGGMHVIFHDAAGVAPGEMKLMRWEDRNGLPCLEAACGKEISVKRESFSAPGNSGWAYSILTPDTPPDLAAGAAAGYYGLVMGGNIYLPLFY